MYKHGKYKYKSKENYQKLLIYVGIIFLISVPILVNLRSDMNQILYNITITVSITMIFHLSLRYAYSKEWISNYPFDNY